MNFLTSTTAKLAGSATRRRLLHSSLSPLPQLTASSFHSSTITTTTTTLLPHHTTTTTTTNNNLLLLTRLYSSTRPLTSPKPPGATHVAHQPTFKEEEEDEGKAAASLQATLELTQRWSFIKKVYGIVTSQVAFTGVVASTIAFNPPIMDALVSVPYLPFVLFGSSMASLFLMHMYRDGYPKNLISLGALTFFQSLTVGVICGGVDGKLVLEAMGITTVAFSSLTAYAFWAASKGKEFNYLGPILFPCVTTLFIGNILQLFLPLPSSAAVLMYSGFGAVAFSGYVVYDTSRLIHRFSHDEYAVAAVHLYLDIINIFIYVLRFLRELNSSRD